MRTAPLSLYNCGDYILALEGNDVNGFGQGDVKFVDSVKIMKKPEEIMVLFPRKKVKNRKNFPFSLGLIAPGMAICYTESKIIPIRRKPIK